MKERQSMFKAHMVLDSRSHLLINRNINDLYKNANQVNRLNISKQVISKKQSIRLISYDPFILFLRFNSFCSLESFFSTDGVFGSLSFLAFLGRYTCFLVVFLSILNFFHGRRFLLFFFQSGKLLKKHPQQVNFGLSIQSFPLKFLKIFQNQPCLHGGLQSSVLWLILEDIIEHLHQFDFHTRIVISNQIFPLLLLREFHQNEINFSHSFSLIVFLVFPR